MSKLVETGSRAEEFVVSFISLAFKFIADRIRAWKSAPLVRDKRRRVTGLAGKLETAPEGQWGRGLRGNGPEPEPKLEASAGAVAAAGVGSCLLPWRRLADGLAAAAGRLGNAR